MNIGILLLLMLSLAGDGIALTQSKKPVGSAATDRPSIEFGHEGGSLRPYRIALYSDGRVEAIEGAPRLKTNTISPDKVKELVAKACRKSFWKGSRFEKRPRLPDFGFVFVKARAASGKVIYRHGAQSGRLGEFYAQLSTLVLEKPG